MTRKTRVSLADSRVPGAGGPPRIRQLSTLVAGFVSAAVLSLALVPAASAQVTPPSNSLTNFNGTGGTFTFNGFDGGTSNVLVAEPGTSHEASTTLTLPNLESGNFYTAPVGIKGFSSPFEGCPFGSGYGSTETATSTFTAPSTAGIYDVTADLGPNFTCQDSWHPAIGNPAIAIVVVTSFESVCSLAQSYSTDPAVAVGLCDKLAAAGAAGSSGATKAQANILRAFDNQVAAQTGKALTSAQADMLTTLAYYLLPS